MSCRAALGGVVVAASRRGRVAAVLALAALALLPVAAPAAAHDDLVASSPREAQKLAALPSEVELEFDEPALAGYSAVAVTGPDGPVAGGEVVEDDVFVRMPVDPVAVPGEYVLAYRVVASDGHPVSGEITFTVTGPPVEDDGGTSDTTASTATPSRAAAGTPTPAVAQPPTVAAGAASGPVTDEDDAGPGVGVVAAIGTGGLLAVAAAALWLLRRRRRPAGHTG